jgi:hypothetical protein
MEYLVLLNAIIPETIPGGALRSQYREDLGDGMHLAMLKRVVNGQFRRWHPDLTFEDVRSGRATPKR